MPRREPELILCTLCGRQVPKAIITEHHLLPREEGGTEEHKVPMCKPCHGHIHATYDNRTLAIAFSTLDALRRDPKILKFVRFIRKQDASSVFRSAYSSTRQRKKR
jgi:hypothetical protein